MAIKEKSYLWATMTEKFFKLTQKHEQQHPLSQQFGNQEQC